MRRPQFSLQAMLSLTAVVAAFFGGIVVGQEMERRHRILPYMEQAPRPGAPLF